MSLSAYFLNPSPIANGMLATVSNSNALQASIIVIFTEIYYAGDDCTKDHKDWADRNNADEVIVLLSSFDVDSSGGDGSLNPNSTYSDWKWILVRTDGGKWQHVDHGY